MRTSQVLIGFVIVAVALAGCPQPVDDGPPGDDDDGETAAAALVTLHDPDGASVGNVTFLQRNGSITVTAEVENLSAGFHGFHIHETGDCSPDFGAAGGHHAPDDADHGDHAGDMPVLLVGDNGTATHGFATDRFTIEELLADDGTAVVVHEDPDNYAHIPDRYTSDDANESGPDEATLAAGDAGPRAACGVVEAAEPDEVQAQLPPAISFGRERAAQAVLADGDGSEVGFVAFVDRGEATAVHATVDDLPTGFHGFHIHETGACDPDFALAGGHHDPGDADHGDHAGDMPVLDIGANRTAALSFVTDRFTVDDLTDLDGSAVIVHEDPDNYANIPDRYQSEDADGSGPDESTRATGDAGARIACGVVQDAQRSP